MRNLINNLVIGDRKDDTNFNNQIIRLDLMKADKTEITEVKYNILQIADEINSINTKIITNANDILNVQKNLDSVNAQLTGNWVAVGAQFLIYEG